MTAAVGVLVLLLSLIGSAAAAQGTADGHLIEVAPGGSLAEAFAAATPGTTIVVHPGTYREDVVLPDAPDGTAGAPIVVRSASAERPRLEGRLWLTTPTHWHVSGLEVTWRDDLRHDRHLVKVTDGHSWTLRDMEIHGAQSFAGLLIVGSGERGAEPHGWTVADSCIHDTVPTNDTNQDHLIYVNTGVDSGGGVLRDNVLFGAANGAGVKLAGPSASKGGAANVQVLDNVISDTVQGVLVGFASRDNRIVGNTFGPFDAPYAPVRSYRLTGDSNVASDNISYGNDSLFFHYDSPDGVVVDGGGNDLRSADGWEHDRSCPPRPAADSGPPVEEDRASHETPVGRRGYDVWRGGREP